MSTRIMYFMYHHAQHCSISAGPPPPAKSTDSFTLFPLLPAELRLKIWQTIAAERQIIELSCTPTSPNLPTGRWFSHTKTPIIFSVCSESRSVAVSEFTLLQFSPDQIGVPRQSLYINWSRDTLWLCNDLSSVWAKDLLEKNEQIQAQLRFLAISESLWKTLNQSSASSSPTGRVPGMVRSDSPLLDVKGNLRALENVKFHS